MACAMAGLARVITGTARVVEGGAVLNTRAPPDGVPLCALAACRPGTAAAATARRRGPEACAALRRALELVQLGAGPGSMAQASYQADLALVLAARGDASGLREAEALARRALATVEKLGRDGGAGRGASDVDVDEGRRGDEVGRRDGWGAFREADVQAVLSAVLAADAVLVRDADPSSGPEAHAALVAWLSGQPYSHQQGPHKLPPQATLDPVAASLVPPNPPAKPQPPNVLGGRAVVAGSGAPVVLIMGGGRASGAVQRPSSQDTAAAVSAVRADKALAAAERAVQLRADDPALGPSSPLALDAMAQAAYAAGAGLGSWAAAEPLYRAVLHVKVKALGPLHPTVCGLMEELAAVGVATGRAVAAARWVTRHLAAAEEAAMATAAKRDAEGGAPGLGEASVMAGLGRLAGLQARLLQLSRGYVGRDRVSGGGHAVVTDLEAEEAVRAGRQRASEAAEEAAAGARGRRWALPGVGSSKRKAEVAAQVADAGAKALEGIAPSRTVTARYRAEDVAAGASIAVSAVVATTGSNNPPHHSATGQSPTIPTEPHKVHKALTPKLVGAKVVSKQRVQQGGQPPSKYVGGNWVVPGSMSAASQGATTLPRQPEPDLPSHLHPLAQGLVMDPSLLL